MRVMVAVGSEVEKSTAKNRARALGSAASTLVCTARSSSDAWRGVDGGLGDAVVVVAFSVGEPATLGAVGSGDDECRRFKGNKLHMPTYR